jgi:hypothetical protein
MLAMLKRLPILPAALALALALPAGCATTGGPAGDAINLGQDYYYDEFADVPIPVDMNPEKDRFTILGTGGVKLGIEEFTGRVDKTSLINAMQNYMLRDGWTLRSMFRASRSILIFEKPDRICSLYFVDGTFSTSMLVFVSPKLTEGDVAYSAPLPPTADGVRSYPAGGFSNTEQPLSY